MISRITLGLFVVCAACFNETKPVRTKTVVLTSHQAYIDTSYYVLSKDGQFCVVTRASFQMADTGLPFSCAWISNPSWINR